MTMIGRRAYLVSGERTRLRRFTRLDVDRWLVWSDHSDPLYSPYNPLRMAPSMRDAWYDDLVFRQGQIPFAVDDFDGRMIGRIFLRHVKRAEGTAVLGIDFAPDFVGQGFGTDALRTFLDYYFGPMGFRRLLLSVAAYNLRARRSYERCGFVYVGGYWEHLKTEADVLRDRRYEDVRRFFRRGPTGLEAYFHSMAAEPPEQRAGGNGRGPG